MKLTQTNIVKAKLPAGKSEEILWDDEIPGFGLRLRESGSRTFIAQYKIGAKHRRITLGKAAKITAEDARKAVRQVFGKIAEGKDPANEKAVKRAEASHTIGALVEDFLAQQAAHVRLRTLRETDRYLRQHWKPLHGLTLNSATRAHVAAEARAMVHRNGAVTADRARSALSTFFTWAIGEGLCEVNPVVGTNRAAPPVSRDRVLADAEVAAVWKAAKPETDFGKIVRLLFLTGCRRDEIGLLRTNEIAPGDSLIALPGECTKNGLPHDVPLSEAARAIVRSIKLDKRDCVFGTRDTGFSNWSKAKRQLDEALPTIKEPWTLHDIRRTVATRMADLGVQPHIIEAVLNHISGHKRGVAGTYNRSTYDKEKREALDTWATHLATIIAQSEGANVVRLKRSRTTPKCAGHLIP